LISQFTGQEIAGDHVEITRHGLCKRTQPLLGGLVIHQRLSLATNLKQACSDILPVERAKAGDRSRKACLIVEAQGALADYPPPQPLQAIWQTNGVDSERACHAASCVTRGGLEFGPKDLVFRIAIPIKRFDRFLVTILNRSSQGQK